MAEADVHPQPRLSEPVSISCGTVSIDPIRSLLLAVHKGKTGHTSLPAGTRLVEESLEETASRQTIQQTGYRIKLLPSLSPDVQISRTSSPAAPFAAHQHKGDDGVLQITFWYVAEVDSDSVRGALSEEYQREQYARCFVAWDAIDQALSSASDIAVSRSAIAAWTSSITRSSISQEGLDTTREPLLRHARAAELQQVHASLTLPSPPTFTHGESLHASPVTSNPLSAPPPAPVEPANISSSPTETARAEEPRHMPHACPPMGSINPAYDVLAQFDAGRLATDPSSNTSPIADSTMEDRQQENNRPRVGSDSDSSMTGALPANDGMGELRREMQRIRQMAISSEEKAKRMHELMTADYARFKLQQDLDFDSEKSPPLSALKVPDRHKSPSPTPEVDISNPYNVHDADLQPTYCPPSPTVDGESNELPDEEDLEFGCQHYKRNVKVQCSTCERWYTCRLCHDEHVRDHKLVRKDIKNMLCMGCMTAQSAGEYCSQCGLLSANYYCSTCKLWDNDVRRRIYHCEDCGICRRGEGLGKDYIHCKKCNVCISIAYATTHRCVERATDCDCPICGEYMFTSSADVVAMKCGHYIHQECYNAYMETSYKCPICNRSAVNMELQWRKLDHCIEVQPMPEQYRNTKVWITCNDCSALTCVRYHWLGNKCAGCDSYNTSEMKTVNGPEEAIAQEEEIRRTLEERGRDLLGGALPDEVVSPLPDDAPQPDPIAGSMLAQSTPRQLTPPHSPTRTLVSDSTIDARPLSPRSATSLNEDVNMADAEDNAEDDEGDEEEQDDAGFWGQGIQSPSWNINPRQWANQHFFAKSDNGEEEEDNEASLTTERGILRGRYFPNIDPREWAATQRFFAKSDDERDNGDVDEYKSAGGILQGRYFPNIDPREWAATQRFFAKSDNEEDVDDEAVRGFLPGRYFPNINPREWATQRFFAKANEDEDEPDLDTSPGMFRGRYFAPQGGWKNARLFGSSAVRAISADALPKATSDSHSEANARERVSGWGIGPSWPGQMPAWIASRIPRPALGNAEESEAGMGEELGSSWKDWRLRGPAGGWTSPTFFSRRSDGHDSDDEDEGSLESDDSDVDADADANGDDGEDEGMLDLVDLPGHR